MYSRPWRGEGEAELLLPTLTVLVQGSNWLKLLLLMAGGFYSLDCLLTHHWGISGPRFDVREQIADRFDVRAVNKTKDPKARAVWLMKYSVSGNIVC